MRNKLRIKTRKLMNRSGNNICPICNTTNILCEHHIQGRKISNANHFSNIANLCSNCHRKVHEGIIVLEGNFQTTNGIELLWHYNNDQSFSGQNIKPYIIGEKNVLVQ